MKEESWRSFHLECKFLLNPPTMETRQRSSPWTLKENKSRFSTRVDQKAVAQLHRKSGEPQISTRSLCFSPTIPCHFQCQWVPLDPRTFLLSHYKSSHQMSQVCCQQPLAHLLFSFQLLLLQTPPLKNLILVFFGGFGNKWSSRTYI